MCTCAERATVRVCVYESGERRKQPLQSSHFCLMKNGRLTFGDVVMCRILM